jgi:hypothetical protein
MSADATCAVCGRTILDGERVHGFLGGGAEHAVCELCLDRAERLGWRSLGEEDGRRPAASGHENRGRLRSFLRRPRDRPGVPAAPPASSLPETDPAAPPRVRPRPLSAHPPIPGPSQRAVVRFNSSEAGRTVAGLVRTLGRPWASVGAVAGAPEEVRITVAWDLCWYQWGVDVSDELRPVFEIDRGQEIEQLDAAAQQWNAAVDAEGRLGLGAPGRPAATGEPAAS